MTSKKTTENIKTIEDATSYIDNSVVADWDWEHDFMPDSTIVIELLPRYLYQNAGLEITFKDILIKFITTELKLDPSDLFNLD